MKALNWLNARVANGLHVVATLMLIGIVVLNAINVVGRYLFNKPMETADELMVFMLTAAVFLCLPRCTQEDTHIRMSLVHARASGRVRKVWDLLLELLHLSMALLVIYVGVPTVAKLFSWGQVSEAAKVPMWIVHSVIPLGFGLAAAILLMKIAQMLCGWRRP